MKNGLYMLLFFLQKGSGGLSGGCWSVPTDLVLRTRKLTERFNEIIHYSEHFSLSENDGERRFTPDLSTLRHTSSVVFDKALFGESKTETR